MRIARAITPSGGTNWGLINGEYFQPLAGPPWEVVEQIGDPVPLRACWLLAPTTPSKIICVGQNYDGHLHEMGYERPARPSVFMKPPTTLLSPDGLVVLPPSWLSERVEHEAELAIVVGRPGRFIGEADALQHVLGFTCANDVSARDVQRSDPYPTRGKGFDTFCPTGPWIETDLDVLSGLRIQCRVNGQTRQDGSTKEMIFDVPFIVSFVSQFTTLLPGDLLLTGSPGGSTPMHDGDNIEIEIEGIGILRHRVGSAP